MAATVLVVSCILCSARWSREQLSSCEAVTLSLRGSLHPPPTSHLTAPAPQLSSAASEDDNIRTSQLVTEMNNLQFSLNSQHSGGKSGYQGSWRGHPSHYLQLWWGLSTVVDTRIFWVSGTRDFSVPARAPPTTMCSAVGVKYTNIAALRGTKSWTS